MRWIIGDIHGMLAPLETLLGAVHKRDPHAQLLFAGDYVNRGPDSKRVIDLLLTLTGARFIRGNHDDVFNQILTGRAYAENGAKGDRLGAFAWFMEHGLDNTLVSYGADLAFLQHLAHKPDAAKLNSLLRECVPDSHRRFLHSLAPVIEFEDLFVIHGKWEAEWIDGKPSLESELMESPQKRTLAVWGRFTLDEIVRPKAWERTGYFGHTPVDNYTALLPESGEMVPIRGNGTVLVDTAAAVSRFGRLTAYCHESQTYLQAHRSGAMVEEADLK